MSFLFGLLSPITQGIGTITLNAYFLGKVGFTSNPTTATVTQTFSAGSYAHIYATPAFEDGGTKYVFDGWSEQFGGEIILYGNPSSVIVEADKTKIYYANYLEGELV